MPTIEEAVAAYIKLRDTKKEIVAKQKDELVPINKKMNRVEGWLHRELNRMHADHIGTEQGTVYKTTRTSVKVQEWDQFLPFVLENGLTHMLERRASKEAVSEYLEANGELPPGLSITHDEAVNIRR